MKSMFGYTRHQPYGLSHAIRILWSVTSHTAPIYSIAYHGLFTRL